LRFLTVSFIMDKSWTCFLLLLDVPYSRVREVV
jgi:hypothetical protein